MNIYFDIETTGLDPFTETSRVTAIGLLPEGGVAKFFTAQEERDLLLEFWNYVAAHPGTYVGFNVLLFDFPYLVKRSIICRVRPHMVFRRQLLDLRNLIDSSPYAKGSLGAICQLINGEHKYEDLTGDEVIQLFNDGNIEKLITYLNQDLLLTQILYLRLSECGLIQS